MKLISYCAIRPGFQAFGSYSVRAGTNSPFSHTEVVFEPGDGVDHLTPDGTTQPDADGAMWCASASALDHIPEWSPRRVGKLGGVRFKRVIIKPDNWLQQDLPSELFNATKAAEWFVANQGYAYDWRNIASFAGPVFNLVFSHGTNHYTCTECCAAALGFTESERCHPGNFPPIIRRMTTDALQRISV